MSDFLKKGFLLGLGAAVSGKEKVSDKLDEMVEKNELTQEQAKSFMRDIIDKGETKTDEWSAKQYEQTQQMAKDLGIATQDDIHALQTRIAHLEQQTPADKEH